MTAPLRRVPIPPDALQRVDRRDRADIWQDKLLAMGLMVDAPLSEAKRRDWSPAGSVARLRRDVVALRDVEHRLLEVRTHRPFRSGAVPAWLLAGMVILVILGIQQVGFLLAITVASLGFGAIAGWGLVHVRRFDKKKQATLAELVAERERLPPALQAELRALVTRPFVARIGRSLLIGRADLDALERAIYDAGLRGADLRKLGRTEDSEALLALRAELQQVAEGLEQTYRRIEANPPERWTDEGLRIDHDAWSARLSALDLSFRTNADPTPEQRPMPAESAE